MKVNILESHDRLLELHKQADYISQGCQDCIDNRPQEFGQLPFYIFGHRREIGMDERYNLFVQDLHAALSDMTGTYKRKYNSIGDTPSHRFIWMPRLSKPVPQTNSMLFKYYPENDVIHVKWLLPAEELWGQYEKGNVTEQSIVESSINMYRNNPRELAYRDEDDISDERADFIYKEIARNKKGEKFTLIS